jgi:hypothetical protein
MIRILIALAVLSVGAVAFLRAIWPRWEGPIEDSIREQEEEL